MRHDGCVRVLVVGDRGDDDPGFVGERLVERGATLVALDRDALPGSDVLEGADLLLLLGSARSAHNPAESDAVVAESRLARIALDEQIPVLGICYGAQLLALTLEGEVMPASQAEVGWFEVDSRDPQLCPPGPWLQFHSDAFRAPPGVRVLGTTPAGCQAFAHDRAGERALAWQFHPETTPAELKRWLDSARDWVLEHGGDPASIQTQADERAESTRAAARELTDAALHWLRVGQ